MNGTVLTTNYFSVVTIAYVIYAYLRVLALVSPSTRIVLTIELIT